MSRAVAAQIQRLLDERGMSGNALAQATGIPQSSISRKLTGVHPFDVDDLAAIAAALGVRPAELLSAAGG